MDPALAPTLVAERHMGRLRERCAAVEMSVAKHFEGVQMKWVMVSFRGVAVHGRQHGHFGGRVRGSRATAYQAPVAKIAHVRHSNASLFESSETMCSYAHERQGSLRPPYPGR